MATKGNTIYRLSDLPAGEDKTFGDSGGKDWIIADADPGGTQIDLAYQVDSGAATHAYAGGLIGGTTRIMYITGAIENVRGSDGFDVIRGNNLANILYGDRAKTGDGGADQITALGGNDTLFGGAGSDTLDGSTGNDKLTGGADDDVFLFDTRLGGNVDHITDFRPGHDTIQLDDAIFKALGDGKLGEKAFVANDSGEAETKAERVIYESDTGKVFYDKDGTGKSEAVEFAVVGKNLDVTSADFFVV